MRTLREFDEWWRGSAAATLYEGEKFGAEARLIALMAWEAGITAARQDEIERKQTLAEDASMFDWTLPDLPVPGAELEASRMREVGVTGAAIAQLPECTQCNGDGFVNAACPDCGGTGLSKEDRI